MALPIICETETILNLWLTEIPEHTIIFVQLSLIMGMCDSLGASGYTACAATGKLKRYSLIITPIGLLEFPLTWLFFAYGAPVVSTYYLYIFVKILVLIARMYLMRDMVGLKVNTYVTLVLIPVITTSIIAIIPSVLVLTLFPQNISRLFISVVVGVFSVAFSVLSVGMTHTERSAILGKVRHIIKSKI
jgi:hypothetical protein